MFSGLLSLDDVSLALCGCPVPAGFDIIVAGERERIAALQRA
jgi:hypothetical protein